VINEKVGMGETVSAVLIPGDEPERFDRWSKLKDLILTFDGLNHHLYSEKEHLGILNRSAYGRFIRFLVKIKIPVKLMQIKVINVRQFE